MKLYDFLKEQKGSFDCWDPDYDDCYDDCYVTVRYAENSDIKDSYDTFCEELYKKVEVLNPKEFHGCKINCKWSKLIEDNIHKFWDFSLCHWNRDTMAYYAENFAEESYLFVIAWINELRYYIDGSVPQDFYNELTQFIKTLKA